MSYHQTIDDYLRDANEAIDFYSVCVDRNHGKPYFEAPWMEAQTITEIFDFAANELAESFVEYDGDIPLFVSDFPHVEHDNELKKIIYLCARYEFSLGRPTLHMYSLRAALKESDKHEFIEEVLSFAPPEKIYAVLALVSAYLSYKMLKSENYEYAIEFVASAQLAFSFLIDICFSVEEYCSIEQMDKNRRIEAAKKGAKNRIESRFKEEIFIPSWQDWQNGEIFYRTQDAFLSEMNRQSSVYLKERGAEKEYISSRAFYRWLSELKK